MSVRIHTTPKYNIEYGSTISSRLTDDIIYLIRASDSGWVSEDELDLEIDKTELESIKESVDISNELKEAINLILEESDPNNDYVHLSIF